VPHEYNILALVKGNEHYVYVFADAGLPGLLDALRDHAADPRLTLSWFDAAVLKDKARQQARAAPAVSPSKRTPA
jgi:hypothetical protein